MMLFPILHGESMVINYLLFIELLYHLLMLKTKLGQQSMVRIA